MDIQAHIENCYFADLAPKAIEDHKNRCGQTLALFDISDRARRWRKNRQKALLKGRQELSLIHESSKKTHKNCQRAEPRRPQKPEYSGKIRLEDRDGRWRIRPWHEILREGENYYWKGRRYHRACGQWTLREAPPPERRRKKPEKPLEKCGRVIPDDKATRRMQAELAAEPGKTGGLAPAALRAMIDRGMGWKDRPPPGKRAVASPDLARADRSGPPESRDMLKQRRLRELAEFARKEKLGGAEHATEAVKTFEARQNETRAERIARMKAELAKL